MDLHRYYKSSKHVEVWLLLIEPEHYMGLMAFRDMHRLTIDVQTIKYVRELLLNV